MNLPRLSVGAVVLLLAVSTAPFGTAQLPEDIPMTTLAEIPVEVNHEESFDDDDGGWTTSPLPPPEARPDPAGTWEWGAPTSGPGFAASGSNVMATNLAGNHDDDMCVALMSPPIDLTGATNASASFESWMHTYQSSFGSNFVYSGGALFATADGGETLTMLTADSGYAGPMGTSFRRCMDDAPSGTLGFGGPISGQPLPTDYSTINVDLSAQVGQTIQFLIAFESYCCLERAGWYVDDFAVTIDGVTTTEDFEADNGGFTMVSTAKPPAPPLGWNHGVVSGGEGPGTDSPLWATNTAGDYGHKECAWLESPEIDLGTLPEAANAIVSANLSWDNWYRGNSLYSAGIVQIGVVGENGTEYEYVEPVDGYPGSASGTYEDQLVACLGQEAADVGAYSGYHDSNGGDMESQQVDLSAFIGDTITVRYFFSSAWSANNPTLVPGWYVDNVKVQTTIVMDGPDVEQIIEDAVPEEGEDPVPGAQAPGWTTGGEASSWEYGVVAHPEGPEGEVAYATNLTGVHHDDECSWIDSPPIPGAIVAADPTLTFSHWFEQYASSFSGTAWNGGVLFVSTDGGTTWEYLEGDAYSATASFSGLETCVESVDPTPRSDVSSFSGDQLFFNEVSFDLSAYAGADSVQVRFMQASGIGIERPGWYLESISVGGVSLLPPL